MAVKWVHLYEISGTFSGRVPKRKNIDDAFKGITNMSHTKFQVKGDGKTRIFVLFSMAKYAIDNKSTKFIELDHNMLVYIIKKSGKKDPQELVLTSQQSFTIAQPFCNWTFQEEQIYKRTLFSYNLIVVLPFFQVFLKPHQPQNSKKNKPRYFNGQARIVLWRQIIRQLKAEVHLKPYS